MIVGSGMACQRLKSALGWILVLGSWPLWVLARCLGGERGDSHLGNGYVRDLRCSAVYAYLAQGMLGVWPYPAQLTNGTNWRDVSWE